MKVLPHPTTSERIGAFIRDAFVGLANCATREARTRVLRDLGARIASARAEQAKLSAEDRALEARLERREAEKWQALKHGGFW